MLSNAWIQGHMRQPVEPWFISSWSSEIKASFWYLNISATWGHLVQQLKHKHKPGSLEYQFGCSAYHNPHLHMKILCYSSFYSVTWSPVETHSHWLVGKGGPYWDEKATIKMNIIIPCNGPVITLYQVREIRAHVSSRGERWVIIIITNIRK